MSDRGLLRSFKPVAEEQLPLEKEELDRQMQEAAGAGGERADSDKARRRAVKTRRKLVRQLSWSPHHAFARASARPACTDVVCLLPLLLLWLVMLAVAVQGGKYGHPTRLLFGMDYERNTCGVRNWGGVLRFGLERSSSFPYEVFLPNARFAPNVTAERQAELSRRNLTGGRDFSGADVVPPGAALLGGWRRRRQHRMVPSAQGLAQLRLLRRPRIADRHVVSDSYAPHRRRCRRGGQGAQQPDVLVRHAARAATAARHRTQPTALDPRPVVRAVARAAAARRIRGLQRHPLGQVVLPVVQDRPGRRLLRPRARRSSSSPKSTR